MILSITRMIEPYLFTLLSDVHMILNKIIILTLYWSLLMLTSFLTVCKKSVRCVPLLLYMYRSNPSRETYHPSVQIDNLHVDVNTFLIRRNKFPEAQVDVHDMNIPSIIWEADWSYINGNEEHTRCFRRKSSLIFIQKRSLNETFLFDW